MSYESDLPSGISAEIRARFSKLSPEEQARVLTRFAETRARRSGSGGIPRNRCATAPLTPAQRGVWILQQLAAESPIFNQSHAWGLRGPLNVSALRRSLDEIVRRHEILRTRYHVVEGEPVQEVMPPEPFSLEMFDAQATGGRQAQELSDFQRRIAAAPFDLTSAPMLRAGLATLGPDHHQLIVTRHHIASDRWSAGVFLRELAALYAAFSQGHSSPLADLAIQFSDYAIWARDRGETQAAQQALADIVQRLAHGAEPPTLVPGLQSATSAASYRGGRVTGSLPDAVVNGLRRLARAHGATLFMALVAVFKALVFRYTDRADLIIGTPIAGRLHTETEPLIGLFANILALRTDLSGDPTFVDLLTRVRTEAVEAFEHQDIPFERVLESLRPGRTHSMAPLTPLIFALQNVEYRGAASTRHRGRTARLAPRGVFRGTGASGVGGGRLFCTARGLPRGSAR